MLRTATGQMVLGALRRETLVCAALVCGFAGATALAAQVRIPLPFSPVPVTLQTFAVLLAGATLGAWPAAVSQGLYLMAGACGAPVFAGGPGALTGPTAGYLWAFPLAAAVVGWLGQTARRRGLLLGLLGGMAIIYAAGVGWLAAVTGQSLGEAVMVGLVPFLAGDCLKAAAVWCLAGSTRRAYEALTRGPKRRGE